MPTYQITPVELGRLFGDDETSLLVGSGTSVGSGLPSWSELIDDMKEILKARVEITQRAELNRFLERDDYLAIADHFRKAVPHVEFNQFLRDRFRNRPNLRLSPILRTLPRLPSSTIFTTNYDKLLEIAYRSSNGEDPAVVLEPVQLRDLPAAETRIIKIHGDIDHPQRIILGKGDYLNYREKYEGIATYLQGRMAFSAMVMVGFGLNDPNFDRLHEEASRLVEHNTRIVALMHNQNRVDQTHWESKNIEIVNFDSPAKINNFLRAAARSIGR